jgi:flagellin FlaB
MKRFSRKEDGFTGLEAAIVLIAFVVVAAVFSYVVLGAGFFTTQKSQETVHTSVTQASSALEIAGDVAARGAAGNVLDYVNFSLQNSAGGSGVDINKITYTLQTSDTMLDFVAANSSTAPPSGVSLVSAEWLLGGLSSTSNRDGNEVLEKYEMVQIGIDVTGATIAEDEEFTIEVKPDIGAPIPIERTAPPAITNGEWYNLV